LFELSVADRDNTSVIGSLEIAVRIIISDLLHARDAGQQPICTTNFPCILKPFQSRKPFQNYPL